MIEPGHPNLSVGKHCFLLSISRSSFYCTPKVESEMNLMLMRRIDEQCPLLGVAAQRLSGDGRRRSSASGR
ncbi:hypothetical protein IWQ54_001379 [Labrenzia sp. EL_195]|nr:hypothetical protein [Labrenzia sp. EL_195]